MYFPLWFKSERKSSPGAAKHSVLTFSGPCGAAADLFKERIKNALEDAHSIYLAARYSNADKAGGAQEEADCPSR